MILLTILFLALMEVALSFDNAVLNAKVLQTMPIKWQQRFITWGMPIAVFGMRFIFPIIIVSLASSIALLDVVDMALHNPIGYAENLAKGHILIDAFGGIFLFMVFLAFHCDQEKEIHWFPWIEKPLQFLSRTPRVLVTECMTIFLLVFLIAGAPPPISTDIGIGGIVAFWTFTLLCGVNFTHRNTRVTNTLISFLYLEILDASCSLDGVVGAFVLTNNIIIITIGLGIGAFAIRSLTLYLVRGGVLKEYRYLEHGAHYGIGALSVIMLTDIFYHIPEPITGMMGIGFIGLSLLSSIKHNKTSQ